MRISVLSSGSKANCTYVECGNTRLLIDCGLSGREVTRRLEELGVDAATLTAVLITHEHCDHLRGVATVSRRYRLPVYVNKATSRFLKPLFGVELFQTGEEFSVGELKVSPFSIVHDASDPVGFVLEGRGIRVAQATDLGKVTPVVEYALTNVNALILESNHDKELLHNCSYPWELKQRIASTHGHLSNEEASSLLVTLSHMDLKHVVLGHLSENSNTPEHALRAVRDNFEESHPFSLQCGSIARSTPMLEL